MLPLKGDLSDIIRDLKKFTSQRILSLIEESGFESRKNWLLWLFKSAGKTYQIWQQDNHPEELETNNFKDQKLEYIHMNPVKAGLVDEPEHYRWSSARDYAGVQGLVRVEIL